MFTGIHIPNFFGKRKNRISQLLKEAEDLSIKELKGEEVLARLFKYFSEFIQKSKQEKIEKELKEYLLDEKNLISYFNRILFTLKRIRHITEIMIKGNNQVLENVEELKTLVEQHNKSKWKVIPLDERKFFLEFQKVCNKRYEERKAISSLLQSVSERINNMIKIIENELKDKDKIDYKNILEFLNSEKQIFLEVAKAELQKLGFEVKSLDDVVDLEELNQVIFSRNFLDKVKQGRKITNWNNRIRRIAMIYVAVFYIGVQTVVPAVFATQDISPIVTQIHHPEIVQELRQEMNEIHFKSYDNIDLSGILVKNNENVQTDKVMLFVHGKFSNATRNLKYINEIRGFTKNIDFLAINLRYHDPSTGGFLRGTTLGVKEAFDVVGAINTLAEMGYTNVVVYGHSTGGAATINALGKYSNLLSKEIKVEGVILEKVYANLREVLERGQENLFSNLGINIAAPFAGAKEYFPKVLPVTDMQKDLSIKLAEKIGGFKVSGNDPAETIKKINVPIIVIGIEHGDVFTTENDAKILAHNARHSKLIIAKNGSTSLIERHSPEFNNTIVIGSMVQFANSLLR